MPSIFCKQVSHSLAVQCIDFAQLQASFVRNAGKHQTSQTNSNHLAREGKIGHASLHPSYPAQSMLTFDFLFYLHHLLSKLHFLHSNRSSLSAADAPTATLHIPSVDLARCSNPDTAALAAAAAAAGVDICPLIRCRPRSSGGAHHALASSTPGTLCLPRFLSRRRKSKESTGCRHQATLEATGLCSSGISLLLLLWGVRGGEGACWGGRGRALRCSLLMQHHRHVADLAHKQVLLLWGQQ
eukprot:CAMPEP_0202357662 /NCGR_PEP_ID=MMETSP1126-20121109/11605_1 /ASSEMBLY_ACC=CAM_ASM_000457 /TAXON_ID=3047 /ORGANISM="Dunaliella tertiolecta, Strain CCMP1320" /LENGTH=240 /DNA_ID=CAMNT_0048950599 /DNA_START=50 /DNA_END=773 /DNA_ORIENTATION=+